MDDLQRAQDAAMVKSGFDEETIRKYKRAKADPIIAPDKGRFYGKFPWKVLLWHRLSDGNTSMMKCFVIFPLRGESMKDLY